jgi:hypothetical protein
MSGDGAFRMGLGGGCGLVVGICLALLLLLVLLIGGCTMFWNASREAQDAAERVKREELSRNKKPVVPAVPGVTQRNDQNKDGPKQEAPKPLPKELPGINRPIQIGDIELTVVGATIGKVELQSFGSGSSEDELITIRIRIVNHSSVKKIAYPGWSAAPSDFMAEGKASLRDEHDNTYKRTHFGIGTRIKGQVHNEDIYPGKSLEDRLVFEVPVSAAKFLFLRLPGKLMQLDEDFEFRFSTALIRGFVGNDPPKAKEPAGNHDEKPPAKETPPKEPVEDSFRTWTDLSGQFKVEAEFKGMANGVVRLKKRDGSIKKIPLEKLSKEDQDWIRERSKR